MIYIEAAFLFSMLASGVLCAISDYRKGTIPNKVLLTGVGAGTVLHGLLLFLGGMSHYPVWAENMLIADALAIIMYMRKLWSAGDSKLFIVLFYLRRGNTMLR